MSKREELIQKYATDLKEKCNINADLDLLKKVVIGCGPSIYNNDSSIVAGSDPNELATVKKNFLIKKLGLPDNEKLDDALESVINQYGKSNRTKYRAVLYYLLTKHFKKESVYQ